ncbi:MAG: hypothetical protein AAF611_02855 [Bacteroidota bacterium]
MKKSALSIVLLVFVLVFSCDSNMKKKTPSEVKEASESVKDSSAHIKTSHVSDTIKSIPLNSKLKEKVTRLHSLEHNYQLKSLDSVTPQKSLLLGNIKRIQKREDSLTKHINIAQFERELHQIQKAFLKGTKPMRPNGNTYPRVTVEEYIFKTSETAKAIYNSVKASLSNHRLWTYVTKSPHELFLEENRMYFMRSGGFYMMEIYKDIFEKIKN